MIIRGVAFASGDLTRVGQALRVLGAPIAREPDW
jgi:hypothetical protein